MGRGFRDLCQGVNQRARGRESGSLSSLQHPARPSRPGLGRRRPTGRPALASALSRLGDSVYTGAMNLIADSAELQAFCARLTKADFITVDPEFLRDSTYWPKLCLLQIAGRSEEHTSELQSLMR